MTTLPRSLTHSPEIQRLARFLLVGALGTLIDFSILLLLKSAGAATLLANSAGFLAGLASNYTWNSRWTFAGKAGQRAGWRQFLQFAAVSLAGLALNNAIVLGLEAPLGAWLADPAHGTFGAKVLATGLVVFWNYFANRFWTFRNVQVTTP